MQRTIKVTGTGLISITPDTLELNITITEMRPTYNESRQLAFECADYLNRCIESCGRDSKELKTKSFDIRETYREKIIGRKNF